MPKPLTSNNNAAGLFDKRDFVYLPEYNAYRCPAGEHAIYRMTSLERGLTQHRYWSSACPRCPLKARCTTGDYRRISRWEHESVLEAMQDRLDRTPNAMKLRRQTVEHVFGTLKFCVAKNVRVAQDQLLRDAGRDIIELGSGDAITAIFVSVDDDGEEARVVAVRKIEDLGRISAGIEQNPRSLSALYRAQKNIGASTNLD